MLKLTCPACSATIEFKSRVSLFGVCSYCRAMIVRHDVNVETLGTMAELPDDVSPLQIGTQGKFDGTAFQIVGRLKIGWAEGTWNEWYLLFDTGHDGWLAEAQGFYGVSFPTNTPDALPTPAQLKSETQVVIGKEVFQIDDIKSATCLGSEGELPMKAPKGRKSTSVDLTGPDGHFACLDYSDEGPRLYVGRYAQFDELNLQNLREIDGW